MIYNNKEIFLMPINPRYTDVEKIDVKNLNEESENFNVSEDLLKYEGNLDDFYELIQSINKNGWLHINDKILLHISADKDKYFILEGNRRFLAYLVISNKIDWNTFKESCSHLNEQEQKEYKKNFNKILDLVSSNIKLILEDKYFEDVSELDSEEIWKTIYSKHIGEQVGKRDWSRAKYFNDLYNMYKIESKKGISHEKIILNLSNLFGKKISIINNDINNSIWVIYSIKIYEKETNIPVNLKNMKVSGFELIRNHVVVFEGKETTIQKILQIKININTLSYSYSEMFTEKQISQIISFLIENSLNGKITTRDISSDIFYELSDLIGLTLYKKRTLNGVYNDLIKKKEKNQELNKIEESNFQFLSFLKMKDINKRDLIYKDSDSIYIKSIKYILRNDLMSASNLNTFYEGEYPFSNVALCLRIILEMLLVELVQRSNDPKIFLSHENVDYSNEDKNIINRLIKTKKLNEKNDIKNLNELFTKIVNNVGETIFLEKIEQNLNKFNFSANFDWMAVKAHVIYMIKFRINKNTYKNQNINLLNELVHKPFIGFNEIVNNKDIIDNFNLMLSTVFAFLKSCKIIN